MILKHNLDTKFELKELIKKLKKNVALRDELYEKKYKLMDRKNVKTVKVPKTFWGYKKVFVLEESAQRSKYQPFYNFLLEHSGLFNPIYSKSKDNFKEIYFANDVNTLQRSFKGDLSTKDGVININNLDKKITEKVELKKILEKIGCYPLTAIPGFITSKEAVSRVFKDKNLVWYLPDSFIERVFTSKIKKHYITEVSFNSHENDILEIEAKIHNLNDEIYNGQNAHLYTRYIFDDPRSAYMSSEKKQMRKKERLKGKLEVRNWE